MINDSNTSKITRSQFIELTNAGFRLDNFEVTERLVIAWLREYPNDLWMRYRLAIVLFKAGKINDAIRLSELIVRYDPEFEEVWGLLAVLYPEGSEERVSAQRRKNLLKGSHPESQGKAASISRISLFRKKTQPTIEQYQEVDDFDILATLKIAKEGVQQGDRASYQRLMSIYMQRWPHVIAFKLLYGRFLNDGGFIAEGTKLIHGTIESDLLGMVAARLWGDDHPYQHLFYRSAELSADIRSIPVSEKIVAAAGLTGLNSITVEGGEETLKEDLSAIDENPAEEAGSQAEILDLTPETNPEIESVEETKPDEKTGVTVLDERRMALSQKKVPLCERIKSLFRKNASTEPVTDLREYVYRLDVTNSDERFPIYVVMSTIGGLTAKYGKNNKDYINREMQAVANAVDNREGWNSMVFFPDEFSTNGRAFQDPILIKKELIKLDQILAEKGSMIGAVLIVGGADVVPFFSLKNPAMDDDLSIPSDAPYATFDEKRIFDQQWQLGRLPGDDSSDPGYLLSQLRAIQTHHFQLAESEIRAQRKNRKAAKKSFSQFTKTIKDGRTFGLSAQIWQRPSVAVYRNIAGEANLMTSPAVTAANFPTSQLENTQYAYFNLHGIKGKPNWYGQKDPRDTSSVTVLPIAVQMTNLEKIRKAPDIVFAENCYGAEIERRNETNAISLHMLGKGTHVFIGSTVIAYGAMTLPLTAADLLAHLFWQHLRTGISSGEAFRRAKKNFASETEAGSGGLDGEIQKTLLSFVFYGDPLYAVDPNARITDRMQRAKTAKSYELVRERLDSKVAIDNELAKQIFNKVKDRCELINGDDYTSCTIQKQVKSSKGYDSNATENESNYVIVYVKEIRQNDLNTRVLTRVTVSPGGDIKKVSFSR